MEPNEPNAEPQPVESTPEPATDSTELLVSDLLVSEISIDGMCGVY